MEKSSKIVLRSKSRRKKTELCNCLHCEVKLDDSNWSVANQKYKRYTCKNCWNLRQQTYQKLNPNWLEDRKKRQKEYRDNLDPKVKLEREKRRYELYIERVYKISIEDYNKMLVLQNNSCAICKRPKPTGKGGFHVDHCHSTGKVRSLLCSKCNLLLGMAEENSEVLLNASIYLEKHKIKDLNG